MQFPPPSRVTAGLLFLVPVVFVGAWWSIYLFAGVPSDKSILESAWGQLQYTFSPENERRWLFVWMAVLPVASVLLAGAYLLNVSRSKPGGMLLLGMSVALAVASFALNDFSLAVFVALPIYWGYRCVHGT